MPDLINDDEQVLEDEKPARSDNRIKDLSEKVKLTAEERDKAKQAEEAAKAETEAAKKDVEFYKGFNEVSSKYPGSNEYQDKILEKVKAGYDLEDATVSVLNKEGKFSAPNSTTRESPIGGSAPTAMRSGGEKSVGEMTRAEKREHLEQAEKESGGVSNILRNGL